MDLFDQSGINGYLANVVRISISYSAKKISKQLGQLRCSMNSLYVIFLCVPNLHLGYVVRKLTVSPSTPQV